MRIRVAMSHQCSNHLRKATNTTWRSAFGALRSTMMLGSNTNAQAEAHNADLEAQPRSPRMPGSARRGALIRKQIGR